MTSNENILHLQEIRSQEVQRVMSAPLNFESQPIEIITKQLTKLHSNYEQRVVYLGPRWANTIALNKSYSGNGQIEPNYIIHGGQPFPKYCFDFSQVSKYSSFADALQRNQQGKNAVYYRAFEGMNPTISTGSQQVVEFNSNFESANLDCAIRVKPDDYDLFLRIDSNTRGHLQWYFFSVASKTKRRVRFNICNLSKDCYLYRKGMRPYLFSTKQKGANWEQSGDDVKFEEKKLRYRFLYEKARVRRFWRLSFKINFEEDETIFVAYCVPYTYSQLLRDISDIQSHNFVTVDSNSKSLMGLPMPIVKITDQNLDDRGKKVILVTGRVHPGQSNGSIMTKGLLKYLCSRQAADLRKRTIFIIIPMLNPDGVVMGNSRTGVMGRDLNRQYLSTNRQIYPQILNIKTIADSIKKKGFNVFMYLDFHGHSQKKNTFVYGPAYHICQPEYFKCKVLPKMVSLRTQMFRYYSCVFKIPEDKKSTGRAVLFQELLIPYVYTVESSIGFYYDANTLTSHEFTRHKWEEMGKRFGESLSEYFVHLAQYEEFINQRKFLRGKKKGISPRKVSSPEHSSKNRINTSSNEDNQKQRQKLPPITTYFVDIIEQIKIDDMLKVEQNDDDKDANSDNADEKQDLDPIHYSSLIQTMTAKKNQIFSFHSVYRQKREITKLTQKQRTMRSTFNEDQMEILNDIIEPRMIQFVERKKNHSAGKVIGFVKQPLRKSPTKQPSPSSKTIGAVNTILYQGLKYEFSVLKETNKKSRSQLAASSSQNQPSPPKKEPLKLTALQMYSPKPYSLPMHEQYRAQIGKSIRKRLHKSQRKYSVNEGSLQKDNANLAIMSKQVREQIGILNSKEIKINYDKLISITERSHTQKLAKPFSTTLTPYTSKRRERPHKQSIDDGKDFIPPMLRTHHNFFT